MSFKIQNHVGLSTTFIIGCPSCRKKDSKVRRRVSILYMYLNSQYSNFLRNEEHGRGASFGCEECARTFPFVKALYGHMNSAHGTRVSKPIVPDMLPEIIHDPQTLELQDLEAPGSNNKCGVCLLTFKSEVGYGNHLTSTLHRIGENSRRWSNV